MSASGKKKQSGREVLQKEDVLQAILVADSFNVRFAPITKRKPRSLLPLANVALVDYTLQFLVEAGMQEVFVYCCAHAEQIKQHLRETGWMDCTSCVIRTIVNDECVSVGDALRDMDGKSLIKSDFVLVTGDLVSNIKLNDIIKLHKERVKVDKQCVMTMIMKRSLPGSSGRSHEDEVVLAVQKDTKKLVHFQKLNSRRCKTILLPASVLGVENSSCVSLRHDLLDCNISICSPNLLPLFSDNFDYQTRDAFIHGILVNEEILGNTIYLHVVEQEYGVRVSNPVMYHTVSQDVLNRWVYPISPDSMGVSSSELYVYNRHNIYLTSQVTQARDSRLEANVMIGSESEVGSGTTIRNAIIGRNCKISCNVTIRNAYIWDDVTIESGCVIDMAIICDNVHLKENTIIKPGCILSYDVVVGPDVTIPEQTNLVSSPDSDGEVNKGVYGDSEKAFVWRPVLDDDDEIDDITMDVWGLTLHEDEDDDSESEVESESGDELMDRTASPQPDDDTTVFYGEVLNTLQRGEEENQSADNIILEINSLKHAYNITIREVNQFVIKAIINYPLKSQPGLDATVYLTQIKQLFRRWMNVLKNYIKRKESYLDCLNTMEKECLNLPLISQVLLHLLKLLYDAELLPEEIILEWYKTRPQDDVAERQKIRKQLVPFITWLEEADEESDDDDSD